MKSFLQLDTNAPQDQDQMVELKTRTREKVLIPISNSFAMPCFFWYVSVSPASLLTQTLNNQTLCQYFVSLQFEQHLLYSLESNSRLNKRLTLTWNHRRRRRGVYSHTPLLTVTLPCGLCHPLKDVLSLHSLPTNTHTLARSHTHTPHNSHRLTLSIRSKALHCIFYSLHNIHTHTLTSLTAIC